MTKKLYLFKCHDNRSGFGSVPIYFDNPSSAKEFGKRDYVSYCGIVNMPKDAEYPVAVYHTAAAVDNDEYVYAWGITDSKELWTYNHRCPC